MPILALVALFAFLVWRSNKRRGVRPEPAEIGAVGWTPATDWKPVAPLARAEARRLLRHPAFLVGVALTPLMMWGATDGHATWWKVSPYIALALVPLGWMTIVAVNMLALQPRRTGADELFVAAPVSQPVRTTGALVGGLVAPAVAAVLATAWTFYWLASSDTIGSPRWMEIAAGVLVVAGAVTVGVGFARWLPNIAFGVVAVFAVSLLQARFMDPSTWPWDTSEAHPGRFLGFLAEPTSVDRAFEVRTPGWHAAYLVGLVLLMAVVALARDGMPRRLAAVLALAGMVIAGTGWVQTRPPSPERVQAMAAYLTDPIAHQTCRTDGPTTLCAYPEQSDRVDDWAARAGAVRALLPAGVASRELVIVDRVPTIVGDSDCSPTPFLSSVPPQVASAVTPAEVWVADGAVHPGSDTLSCSDDSLHELFTAVQVGSWAVGLPPSPHGLDVRCAAAGQARAVVALWLGGAVTPGGGSTLRKVADEHSGPLATFDGWDSRPMFGAEFAIADIELAIALLERPVDDVASTVRAEWDSLTAATTPSSEIAELFSLSASGGKRSEDPCT